MNDIAHAQLVFQMLTLQTNICYVCVPDPDSSNG